VAPRPSAASELYPESVAVNVMLEGAEGLSQVDLVLVTDVLATPMTTLDGD
jgi:hypothetical protein